MYASDWLFALFSNIIPLSQYHHFLTGFFSQGWSLFYKFSLSYMRALKPDLLQMTDLSEILFLIKLKHVNRDEDQDLVQHHKQISSSEDNESQTSSSYIGNDTSNNNSPQITLTQEDKPYHLRLKSMLGKMVSNSGNNNELCANDFQSN